MASRTENIERIDKHITQRYEILQKIGKGAYGIVWKVMDKVTHRILALKKIFGAFRNSTDAQRTYREITFLKQLFPHPNIVELVAVHKAVNNNDLYVVFELLESDVHSVIRANILQDVHKRFITYQLLVGIRYLHMRHLIHRDLKPSNLLINSDSTVKLCDFGLARTLNEGSISQQVLTEYVSTRWYRAPELIIGSNHYSEAVDMWAIGCIVAELYAGRPFFPGNSTVDQLERVVAFTGPPSVRDVRSMRSEFAETMVSSLTYTQPRITLEQKLPNAHPDVRDFISQLLVFNPDKRMTIDKAIEHPMVQQFRNKELEAMTGPPIRLTLRDNKRYTVRDYRNKMYRDLLTKLGDERPSRFDKVPMSM